MESLSTSIDVDVCFEYCKEEIERYDFDIVSVISDSDNFITNILRDINIEDRSFVIAVFTQVFSDISIVKYISHGADIVSKSSNIVMDSQLNALIKRVRHATRKVKIGDVMFDPIEQTIQNGESIVQLNATETKIMALLVKNMGKTVTFDLFSARLKDSFESVTKQYTKVYIHRIRKLLNLVSCDSVQIKSHYGVGYSLLIP